MAGLRFAGCSEVAQELRRDPSPGLPLEQRSKWFLVLDDTAAAFNGAMQESHDLLRRLLSPAGVGISALHLSDHHNGSSACVQARICMLASLDPW